MGLVLVKWVSRYILDALLNTSPLHWFDLLIFYFPEYPSPPYDLLLGLHPDLDDRVWRSGWDGQVLLQRFVDLPG